MFFNVGSGEVLVILLIALVVLGPDKLPDAMRKAGRVMGEVRKVSDGFRAEVRSAMDDPLEAAARDRGQKAVAASKAATAADTSPAEQDTEKETESKPESNIGYAAGPASIKSDDAVAPASTPQSPASTPSVSTPAESNVPAPTEPVSDAVQSAIDNNGGATS